jgi:PIN domain nuclease of toxin-antitoxin system
MRILIDTHIWLWNLAGSPELPAHFKDLLSSSRHEIWLSPITLWEVLVLAEKGRISLNDTPDAFIEKALQLWQVKEAPLDFRIARKSQEINLPYQDPADRFIAATAIVYGLRLMTVDKRLIAASEVPTLAKK